MYVCSPVLKSMLGQLSEPMDHSDWSSQLLQIEHAINNSIHSTTKQTPSQLLFGVIQRGGIVDELTEYLDANGPTEIEQNMPQRGFAALEAIERTQKYSADRAAKLNRPAKQYEISDFVVIRNVDTTVGSIKKLIPKYRGPYRVHKTLGHDR